MAIEVVGAVLRTRLGQAVATKMVLVGLADHAHADGSEARPSVATLAEYAECDARTVKRHLRKLVDAGVIAVQREATPRSPTVYWIRLDRLAELRGDTLSPPAVGGDRAVPPAPRGDTLSPQVGQVVTPGVTQLRPPRGDTAVSPEPSYTRPQPSGGRRPRRIDFDVLAAVAGVDVSALTKSMAATIGTKLAEIREAERRRLDRDPTPEEVAAEIRTRAGRFRRTHPEWSLTAASLAKYWATLGGAPRLSTTDGADVLPHPEPLSPAEAAAAERARVAAFTRWRGPRRPRSPHPDPEPEKEAAGV